MDAAHLALLVRVESIADFKGKKEDKYLLGGKGANLAEMTNIGLPVPPGFVISTGTCLRFFEEGEKLPAGLE